MANRDLLLAADRHGHGHAARDGAGASCVPENRTWTVTLLGTDVVSAPAAGVGVEPLVEPGVDRVSVTIADVPASSGFEVSIGF